MRWSLILQLFVLFPSLFLLSSGLAIPTDGISLRDESYGLDTRAPGRVIPARKGRLTGTSLNVPSRKYRQIAANNRKKYRVAGSSVKVTRLSRPSGGVQRGKDAGTSVAYTV